MMGYRGMIRPLDMALYLASALLTAAGLSWIKWLGLGTVAAVWQSWPGLVAALGLYVAGLGCWLWALVRNPLSVAYPIGIGLSLVAAVLAATMVLGEALTPLKIIGIATIMLGTGLITRSQHD